VMENWHKARTKSALVSHVVSSAAAKNQSDALKFVFSFEMFSNELLDDDDDGFAALPYEDPVNLIEQALNTDVEAVQAKYDPLAEAVPAAPPQPREKNTKSGDFSVWISGHNAGTQRVGHKGHNYEITCQFEGGHHDSQWMVVHSYSAFSALNDSLITLGVTVPPCPRKHYFHGSHDPSIIAERMTGLNAYLQGLLTCCGTTPAAVNLLFRFLDCLNHGFEERFEVKESIKPGRIAPTASSTIM